MQMEPYAIISIIVALGWPTFVVVCILRSTKKENKKLRERASYVLIKTDICEYGLVHSKDYNSKRRMIPKDKIIQLSGCFSARRAIDYVASRGIASMDEIYNDTNEDV